MGARPVYWLAVPSPSFKLFRSKTMRFLISNLQLGLMPPIKYYFFLFPSKRFTTTPSSPPPQIPTYTYIKKICNVDVHCYCWWKHVIIYKTSSIVHFCIIKPPFFKFYLIIVCLYFWGP
jgi:hypothetical protein